MHADRPPGPQSRTHHYACMHTSWEKIVVLMMTRYGKIGGHHLDMYADGIQRYLLANGLKRIARAHRCISSDRRNETGCYTNGVEEITFRDETDKADHKGWFFGNLVRARRHRGNDMIRKLW